MAQIIKTKLKEEMEAFWEDPLVWGWAWKDRWLENDIDLSKWPEVKANNILDEIFNDEIEKEYWEKFS